MKYLEKIEKWSSDFKIKSDVTNEDMNSDVNENVEIDELKDAIDFWDSYTLNELTSDKKYYLKILLNFAKNNI